MLTPQTLLSLLSSSQKCITVTHFCRAGWLLHLLEKKTTKGHKFSCNRLVLKARKRDHVTPLLRALHWLPIQDRVDYKLSTFCHSFFSCVASVYLSDLLNLSVYSPSRQLRSSSEPRILRIPPRQNKKIRTTVLFLMLPPRCLECPPA